MRRLAAVLILAALPVAAQTPRQILFPHDGSCYLRQYSREHLATHPDQMVTQIALGPEYGQAEADVLVLRLAVQARGSAERFTASAYCDNAGDSLSCGIEGDGGLFTLTPGRKGALTMKVGRDPLGFEGARGFFTFGGGVSDDETFLIPPVPADSCP
jgi:hypothetical protein